jgi:putative heme-binding domain-containing protein
MPLLIEIEKNPDAPLRFSALYQADFDPHDRPLRLEHLFVPWAPDIRPPAPADDSNENRETIAGDPVRGRELFFSEEIGCARCHLHGGEGTDVAADLTVSSERSAEAVLRDIIEPSASINPDYVAYEVALKNGDSYFGLVKATTESELTLVDATARQQVIRRSEIGELRVGSTSLMPEGFAALGEEKLRDLVAFLCSPRPAK